MALIDALNKPIVQRIVVKDEPGSGAGSPLNRIIAPRLIEEQREALCVGDTWYVFLEARDFPPAMTMAWLNAISELDHARIFCWWAALPIPNDTAQRILGARESAARDTLTAEYGSAAAHDVKANQGYESIVYMRRAIASGSDRLVRLGFIVAVAAPNEEEARTNAQRVRAAAAAAALMLAPIPFEQYAAYLLLLRGWHDQRAQTPCLQIDSSASVAATLAPTEHAAPRQRSMDIPIIWGVHVRTNETAAWDRTHAVNPHALIVASSGSGKTYAMRGLIAQEWALTDDSHHIFIIDPKFREYRNLVASLGGAYLSLDDRGEISLNPLELPRMSEERKRIAQSNGEQWVTQHATVVRTMIVQELNAHHYRITPSDAIAIERAIVESYAEYGITDDIDSINRAEAMPTLGDVQRCLERSSPELARQFALFTEGAIGRLINRPSNISVNHRLIGFDVSSLLASDDPMMARVLPSVVMMWVMTRSLTSARRSHIILDEAHAILRHDSGMRIIERIFRVGRSLGMQATVITQSMLDVTGGFATIVNENAATKLILGIGANAAEIVAQSLNLTPSAKEYIAWCHLDKRVGSYALLITEAHATPILIRPWNGMMHQLAMGEFVSLNE